ncbi:hypothetical protein DPMN_112485 [Dreissena polymorpha]|uniref:Uncharacterized protein n=1 Tax=Dreissena polymorpha TaxID=45954 RepID=A0A9D4KFT1_DREPO|nr:hypothetical protein DPMN_112485 [Dreissena polymorpha]
MKYMVQNHGTRDDPPSSYAISVVTRTYNKSMDLPSECDQNCAACVSTSRAVVTDITIKDHFFDHRKGSKKKGGTETLYKKALKDALGVRWEKLEEMNPKCWLLLKWA